jgi:hypothetical protein
MPRKSRPESVLAGEARSAVAALAGASPAATGPLGFPRAPTAALERRYGSPEGARSDKCGILEPEGAALRESL